MPDSPDNIKEYIAAALAFIGIGKSLQTGISAKKKVDQIDQELHPHDGKLVFMTARACEVNHNSQEKNIDLRLKGVEKSIDEIKESQSNQERHIKTISDCLIRMDERFKRRRSDQE